MVQIVGRNKGHTTVLDLSLNPLPYISNWHLALLDNSSIVRVLFSFSGRQPNILPSNFPHFFPSSDHCPHHMPGTDKNYLILSPSNPPSPHTYVLTFFHGSYGRVVISPEASSSRGMYPNHLACVESLLLPVPLSYL